MAVAAVDDDAAKLLRDANVEDGTANDPPLAVAGRLAVSAVPMLLRAAVAVADDAPMIDLRAAAEAADENAEPAMLFRTMPGLLAMPARAAVALPAADAECALDDTGGAGRAGAEAAAAAAAAAAASSARRCAASCTAAVTSYWLIALSKCACLIASGESGVGRHESSSWCE